MPTTTYTALATTTLAGTATSVTFSSIPATYRDLVVVLNGATTDSSETNLIMRFNGDTGSNYSFVRMLGQSPTTISSDSSTVTSVRLPLGNTGGQGMNVANIMDYSATDKHKTVLSREDVMTIGFVAARASRWANTSAITSVVFSAFTGNIATGTTLSLYGVIS